MATVTSATKHFPTAKEGFTTTLNGSLADSPAPTSVLLNSVAGFSNGEVVVLVVDPTDAVKKQVFTGVVDTSGIQITNVVWTEGTPSAHANGATVVDYETATHWALYSKGILTHADQDGTLKAGAVDNAAVVATGILTADKNVPSANIETFRSEAVADFIASGGVVAQSAGLVGTFSNIVYYISGVRYTATSIANKTYTASKDTYVDINGAGTVTYVEVANGAASPALTANSIRVAKVVTNGSAITSVAQNGVDSLGNKIYNLAPDIKRSFPVLSRQGGSSTNWGMAGTSNYDTRGTGAFVQTGTIAVTANPTTVTYPVAFSQVPTVFATMATASSANAFVICTAKDATTASFRCVNDGGVVVTTEAICWIAIGI